MKTTTVHRAGLPSKQQGFSLIITLILLSIVTILGMSASQMVLMSERTTRFDRDSQIAFQAAEAALVDASLDIKGVAASAKNRAALFEPKNTVNFPPGCGDDVISRGMCQANDGVVKPIWYQVDFTDESNKAKTVKFGEYTGREFAMGSSGVRPELSPRYIVEVIKSQIAGADPDDVLYRITAMGFGPRKETQVVLQVVFRKD